MINITKNIVGPGSKVYEATFAQVASVDEVGDYLATLGVDSKDFVLVAVNAELKAIQKSRYLEALESTPDSNIAKFVAAAVSSGMMTLAEALAYGETKRANLGSGLPSGLKDLNRQSKRGRPASDK